MKKKYMQGAIVPLNDVTEQEKEVTYSYLKKLARDFLKGKGVIKEDSWEEKEAPDMMWLDSGTGKYLTLEEIENIPFADISYYSEVDVIHLAVIVEVEVDEN